MPPIEPLARVGRHKVFSFATSAISIAILELIAALRATVFGHNNDSSNTTTYDAPREEFDTNKTGAAPGVDHAMEFREDVSPIAVVDVDRNVKVADTSGAEITLSEPTIDKLTN